MRDTNEKWEIVKGAVGAVIILAIFVIFFLTGCKTVRNTKKSTSDSTSVSSVKEVTAKSDSSGSKTENTKETVYYPQPIYIQGKDGENKIVFVPQSVKETGKTEQAQVIVDNSWREAFDSLNKSILTLSNDRKTSVLNIWQIIAIGAIVILIIKFLPFKISRL